MFQGESCWPVVEQHHEIDVASDTAGNDVDVYAASEADLDGRRSCLSRSRLYRTLWFLFVPGFVRGMLVSGGLTLAYNARSLFSFLEPPLAVNAQHSTNTQSNGLAGNRKKNLDSNPSEVPCSDDPDSN